jgi:hypothetical protein
MLCDFGDKLLSARCRQSAKGSVEARQIVLDEVVQIGGVH